MTRYGFKGTKQNGKPASGVRRMATSDDVKRFNKEIAKLSDVSVWNFDTNEQIKLSK